MNNKKWYQKLSNWLIIIFCSFLIFILTINLYIMIASHTNQDKVPSVFGIKPFIVLSESMETEIHKGDLILTRVVEPSTLKVKDIIAFRDANNTVTTHRIIDIIEDNGITYFITKGDSNNTQDENLVGFNDVEGIYTMRIPGIGSMMNTLAEPTTIIILLLSITVIFVIGFGISNKKQREEERKEFLEYKLMKENQEREKIEKKKKEELMEAISKAVTLEEQEPAKKEISKTTAKASVKKVEKKPIKKVTAKTTTKKTAELKIEEAPAKRKPGRPKKEVNVTKEEPKAKVTTKSKSSKSNENKTNNKKTTKKVTTVKATPKKSTTKTTTNKDATVSPKKVGRPRKTEPISKPGTARTKKVEK